MKDFRALAVNHPHLFRIPNLLVIVSSIAVIGWIASGARTLADNNCTVCHKNTTTLTFACDSLDYRRHKDHGDPDGPCGGTPLPPP